MVPIDHVLDNGNIVEIITSPNSKGPSIDWLKIAKSSHARNKIRQWLKKENKSEHVEKGRAMLERYIRRKGYDPQQIIKTQRINRAAKELNCSSMEDLYSSIGYGGSRTSRKKMKSRILSRRPQVQSIRAAKPGGFPSKASTIC